MDTGFQIENGILIKYTGSDQDVTIPDGTTTIGLWAFDRCENLKSITIPDSVKSIEEDAFYGCRNLDSVYYAGDITGWCGISFSVCGNIGSKKFSGYEKITSVCRTCWTYSLYPLSFPHHMYLKNAEGKYELIPENLTIPEGVTRIENGAFAGCCDLESITIPNSVTSIGDCAFSRCVKLASVTILEGVERIGDEAFSLCDQLQTIVIPRSLKKIGSSTCVGCYILRDFFYQGTEEEWRKIGYQFRSGEYEIMENFHRPGQAPYTIPWTDETGHFLIHCCDD